MTYAQMFLIAAFVFIAPNLTPTSRMMFAIASLVLSVLAWIRP